MANNCTIKNKKKKSLDQINYIIFEELKNKFHFNLKSEINRDDGEIEININGWIFAINLYENELSFFDCPDEALRRNNYENPQLEKSLINSRYFYGVSCGYSFIYEYIKNFLASYMGVKINSDGIGKYAPFENPDRFTSFNKWMDYCEEQIKKESLPYSMIKSLMIPTKKQILTHELKLFPEIK